MVRQLALGILLMAPLIYLGVTYVHPFINASMSPESDSAARLNEENARASSASGVRALRHIGCEALVIDVATMPELTYVIMNAGIARPDTPIVIECRPLTAEPPTCDAVAAAYISSEKQAAGDLRVIVTSRKGFAGCNAKYDARGERIVEAT